MRSAFPTEFPSLSFGIEHSDTLVEIGTTRNFLESVLLFGQVLSESCSKFSKILQKVLHKSSSNIFSVAQSLKLEVLMLNLCVQLKGLSVSEFALQALCALAALLSCH